MQDMHPLGFPYPAVDPLGFLVEDEIRKFSIDKRHDLTGTGDQKPPMLSTGQFIVHEHVVPDNTAEVIMGVFPHVWQRTDVGGATESVHLIDFRDLAGFVLFDNTKDNNQPYLVETDYNKATIFGAGGVDANDTDRDVVRGTTFIDDDAPVLENIGMRNPYSTIYLPAKSLFRVIFSLAPATTVPPGVPNPFRIRTAAVPAPPKPIDFAGAKVFGLRMPQQRYEQLRKARRVGKIGQDVQAPVGDVR